MQLFHAVTSPFVRKVMVVLHETGQTGDVEIVPSVVTPTTTGDPVLSLNPLGKIPTLTRPDGPALYDSRVICRYLDSRAGGMLYPASRIWEVLTLEATADGIMEAAIAIVYESRLRTEAQRSPEWIAAQWDKIARSLDVLGERWLGHLAGPLDMGQIAVGCALGYIDLRHGDRRWRSGRDPLAAWEARFAQRPSMLETRPV